MQAFEPLVYQADDGSTIYVHRIIVGEGATATEAILDWYREMPPVPADHEINWRVKPELASNTDFVTNKTTWRVFSRFTIISHT